MSLTFCFVAQVQPGRLKVLKACSFWVCLGQGNHGVSDEFLIQQKGSGLFLQRDRLSVCTLCREVCAIACGKSELITCGLRTFGQAQRRAQMREVRPKSYSSSLRSKDQNRQSWRAFDYRCFCLSCCPFLTNQYYFAVSWAVSRQVRLKSYVTFRSSSSFKEVVLGRKNPDYRQARVMHSSLWRGRSHFQLRPCSLCGRWDTSDSWLPYDLADKADSSTVHNMNGRKEAS
jgi:hypothetical protein